MNKNNRVSSYTITLLGSINRKKKNMKKGFTLIELLAVIVILAIIALIATPIVLDIITDSKVAAKERSIENIERAAKLYIVSEYETKNESAPSEITIGELKSKGYIQNTDEDENKKVFVYMNDTDYIFYYEGRDSIGDYKTLKSLIESDTKHIKKNVVVNGNTVNKIYGTKAEQLTMNNYVLYSGQLWEALDTNDTNNTIKLVSPVSLTSIAYGETNDWNTSWVKKWLNEYFYSRLERTDLIKDTEFCIDPVDVTPDSYTKMTICTNKVTEKVGLLTYEDYIYALDGMTIQDGGSYLDEDEVSWLITSNNTSSNKNWQTYYENPSKLSIEYSTNTYGLGVRPVINIKDNVLVKEGKGTRANPYILSSERSLKENTKLNLGKVGDYVYIEESNNPYVTEFTESYVNKVSNKTSTSKVRYRIVEINSDGSIKVERADVLRNLPDTVAIRSGINIPFYGIDSGAGSTSCLYSPEKKYGEENMSGDFYLGGCTNHNRFDLMKGEGEFVVNTGENLPYYLNNATNSFYNWYSNKTKDMIITTTVKLKQGGYARDYSILDEEGEVTLNVVLPSWGEMYTGNDLNTGYWYTNRWISSSVLVSLVYDIGRGDGTSTASPWLASRPVITLSSMVYITGGEGTANNPYSLNI